MPRTRTVVFVGPTLARTAIEKRLPDAIIRPPVAVGDVLALTRDRRLARIAIIDGYFERMAAVWHKEILVAIHRGIAVWGGASMGALRAAELGPWGMVGAGEIHRAFAAGELEADDEVAVAHLSAEHDHRPVSDALVNLRDGLARAAHDGAISAALAARLAVLARARPYRERSWRQLNEDGAAAGLPSAALTRLARWAERTRPDRKGDDARLLLRRLAVEGWTKPAPVGVPRTWALVQLEHLLDDPIA